MIDTFTIGVKPPDSQSQSTTDDLIACLEKAIDEPSSSPDGTIIAKLKERITARLDGAPEALVATFVSSKGKQKKTYIKKSVADALTTHAVTIPANFAGLEAQMVPTRLEEQYFRVVEVVEDEDCVTITARHVWYDNLQNFTLWKPTEDTNYTVAETCRQVISNAVSTANMRVASDCKTQVKHKKTDFENKNLIECFLDPENGICAKYGLSLIRNNWDCYCLKDVGFNRGMVIQNGKNLLGVERTESIENLVTRVAPIGKDKKGNVVWLDYQGKKYIDSQYINDYAYPRTEIYDTGLQIGKEGVTAQNIQAKLLESAQKRFSEDKVDVPSVSMTIEFLSLGDTEEYQQYRDLDKVYLYDILTIKDTIRGYSYTAQVIGVEHDILTGMLNSVTIGKLDNWDGTRKIASWQVPEVDGTNIRLKTIMAGSFEDGAINSDDLATGAVHWIHLDAASITELTTEQLEALQANIHTLIAGSITADDITTGSLTADLIAAGAITSTKIAAGAIDATKIDANAVSAINALLGTATITNGYIDNAVISYADIKAATAESLFARDAITDKYYIDKLAVNSAQMAYATVGELIIKATDDHYYRLDVDQYGAISPTDVTNDLTSAEINAGVTSNGRSAILETDLTVQDLSASTMKVLNALIDKLTASRIDVSELWARQAFINQLMVTDISSNTYIQSTIGNWASSSTITQEMDSLNSRISSLGYGTVYMQPEEPSHSELVPGDIWIQTQASGTWQEVYNDYSSWQEIYNDVSTWQTLGGVSIMWVWDGRKWQEQLNALDSDTFSTEIAQNTNDISLLATRMTSAEGDITSLSASLTVASNAITAEVTRATSAETEVSNAVSAETTRATNAENNRYTIRSGIAINADGIELSGSKYIRMKSGNTVSMTLDSDGINMATAGNVAIHAKDSTNSYIIFGTDVATAPFSVGIGGDVKAKTITAESVSVNGSQLPAIIVSETQPSGSNVVWIKPSSSTDKQWSKTPDIYSLNQSGGTLGYYRDYTISYGAADYLSGNLFYGIKVRLYYYGNSFQSVTLKARLQNGNSWIELGNVSKNVSQGSTVTLDSMTASATTNIMSVTGGTFTVRIETSMAPGACRLVTEDFILKAQTTSTGGFAASSVFYKS